MSPQDVARALAGDRNAMQALVSRLLPVVQAEVGYALLRGARMESRDHRQAIRDFVQDVFVLLLARNGKTLRAWDPERGRSLDNYVRLVARRHMAATLRSGKKSPWTNKPVAGDEPDRELPDTHSEASTSAKLESIEQLDRTLDGLRTRLDERGTLLFQMLYVEERSVEEVMAATEMTRDAIYAWRSRFRKLVAKLADEGKPRLREERR